MDIVVDRCAGLDVHKDSVVTCVRVSGPGRQRSEEIATFGTVTVELLVLRDWLESWGVTLVAMESTEVYLEACVLRPRRRDGVLAAQPPASAQ